LANYSTILTYSGCFDQKRSQLNFLTDKGLMICL